MIWQIFVSSLILALIFLPLLAWKWKIRLHLAAISAIIIGALTGFIVNWIVSTPLKMNLAVTIFVELIFIFLIAAIATLYQFYRDPERVPPETEKVILCPADGKIIYTSQLNSHTKIVTHKGQRSFQLEEITSTRLLPDAAYLVGIEMNLLNVHVNRSPIQGRIIFQKHINGRFISLGKPEAEIVNERVSTVIDNGIFRVGVIQIASRLVHRIVSYLSEGDPVAIGQRIGMIKFGSQVDIIIPKLPDLAISVQPGDLVKAGITILARYK